MSTQEAEDLTPSPKVKRNQLGQHVFADALAGGSVALVLIPQALAYAELAGVPAVLGLTAAALPPIAASLFASSPYLQTGPTALSSLMTFGILSGVLADRPELFVGAAALLGVLVGVARVLLGLLRLGGLAYFMSRPVLTGFTSAAALLIMLSQLPASLNVQAVGGRVFTRVWYTLSHPQEWYWPALGLCLLAIAAIEGGKRISKRLPSVLFIVMIGIGITLFLPYQGVTIGAMPADMLSLFIPTLQLPWQLIPELVIGAFIISLIGFAEPASIARTYALKERQYWNPNREFISQGIANIAAGFFGTFPVGGSFSRSALNYISGAQTRLSGFFTGFIVLLLLPLTSFLGPLPKAVLSGIIIASAFSLFQIITMWRYRKYSTLQWLVTWGTFFLTLIFAPRVDYGVVAGIVLAVIVHLYREARLNTEQHVDAETGTLFISLKGVLWFGSAEQCAQRCRDIIEDIKGMEHVVLDATGLGRMDVSGAMVLADMIQDCQKQGMSVELRGLQPHMQRVFGRVLRGEYAAEPGEVLERD